MTYARVPFELITRPRGFFPPFAKSSLGSGREDLGRILQLDPDDVARIAGWQWRVGALIVGTPCASRSTRRSRLVAARTAKPSLALRLNAIAKWVSVEELHTDRLEVDSLVHVERRLAPPHLGRCRSRTGSSERSR